MIRLIPALGLSLVTSLAVAQDHSGHSMAAKGPFDDINAAMHTAMTVPPSGDIDVDFARSMIAHHEGAVAMAKALLEQGGDDPEITALAQQIIAAQEPEIAFMKEWLAKNGY